MRPDPEFAVRVWFVVPLSISCVRQRGLSNMKRRMNIFTKTVSLVVLLLVPVISLYGFSNIVSVGLLENEIKVRNLNRLSIFQQQIDANIEKLSSYLLALSADPDILQFKSIHMYTSYGALQIKSKIIEKIQLQNAVNNWPTEINIYSLAGDNRVEVGTRQTPYSPNAFADNEELRSGVSLTWKLIRQTVDGRDQDYLIRHIVQPFTSDLIESPQLIIEMKLSVAHIRQYLSQLKDRLGDPFLYLAGHEPIAGNAANRTLMRQLIHSIDMESLAQEGSLTIDAEGETYLVSYVRLQSLKGILVDYVPLQSTLSPIRASNVLFYSSVVLLLALSLLASLMMYRNVHRPIRELMNSMKKFKQGHYNTRLALGKNSEFDFLFVNFNQMADQIENLVVKVYEEKIRAHEANLKQLQSQINPHFLYNCLYFIKNMAKLGNDEAVEAMALHLARYYRYTTRVETQMVQIREELELVVNYLEIHRLRMQRIRYEVNVPEWILDLEIPRLLFQPIVENAIVHGIEPKTGEGMVKISGDYRDHQIHIFIEDNGVGLSEDKRLELEQKTKNPMDREMGCGIWNVHQRLVYQFGKDAGLRLYHVPEGGFGVLLHWRPPNGEGLPNG